jgi:hypothetical protein
MDDHPSININNKTSGSRAQHQGKSSKGDPHRSAGRRSKRNEPRRRPENETTLFRSLKYDKKKEPLAVIPLFFSQGSP